MRLYIANEKLVYLKLKQAEVRDVAGFAIPELLAVDDDRLVVEIEIVRPPFIVDFAGAYLDRQPPFSPEEWAAWEQERHEMFEADWKWVKRAISQRKRHGIFLNDVKPGNVTCR